MWGQLGGQDWNAALKKLGNAVAPPPGDDDDEEEYEDEEEEYDDEEDYEEEDDDSRPVGFGFVGMLARALDKNQQDYEEEENSYSNTLADVPIVEPAKPSTLKTTPLDTWDDPPPEPPRVAPVQKVREQPPAPVEVAAPQRQKYSQFTPPPKPAPQPPAEKRAESLETTSQKSASTRQNQIANESAKVHQPPQAARRTVAPSDERAMPNQPLVVPSTTSNGGITSERKIAANDPIKDSKLLRPIAKQQQQQQQQTAPKIMRPVVAAAEGDRDAGGETVVREVALHKKAKPESNSRTTTERAKTSPVVQETSFSGQYGGDRGPRATTMAAGRTLSPSPPVEVPPMVSAPTEKSVAPVRPVGGLQPERKPPSKPPIAERPAVNDQINDVRLQQAEAQILALQKQLREETDRANQVRETMMIQFQEKEARLLQASSEEYQHELSQAEHRHQAEIQSLEMKMANDKNEFVKGQQKYQQMIEESNARAERAETELRNALKKHESKIAQANQQEQRSVRMAEDKLAQSLALLDERDEEIARLNEKVKKLESSMNEHEEGVEEAEQEVEELQIENEQLQDHVERLEAECAQLKEKVATLENDTSQLGALQMELTMVREERDRERAKSHSVVQSTITSHSQVESERDTALAEVRDLKQQLTAALADLDIARADQERIMIANANLQAALEAFQDERQAEMNMLEEQRMDAEEAINSAHAAAVEALKQTHAEEIRQVQYAAEERVKQAMDQVTDLKAAMHKLKSENAQTRRSLDEAIHRLQTTQEDVIDRTLMKNILLDWCTMKDRDKRHQVLQLMASVLHFTDEEKESVHLTHMDIESVRAKVVGALAAPLPPSKASLEQLQGDNVSEKWVNFLLSETDDGF